MGNVELPVNARLYNAVVEADINALRLCIEQGADVNYVANPYTLGEKLWKSGIAITSGITWSFYKYVGGQTADATTHGIIATKRDSILHVAVRIMLMTRSNETQVTQNTRVEILRTLVAAGANRDFLNDQNEKPADLLTSFWHPQAEVIKEIVCPQKTLLGAYLESLSPV